MLERASTCLESGGRQLLRGPKQCLRSRRMLHSAFWHHGASDLSLPMWWAASSLLHGEGGDMQYRLPTSPTTVASNPTEGTLLDFLYPEKTLALLKRLSVFASDAPQTRRSHCFAPVSIRQYSTAQHHFKRDKPRTNTMGTAEAKRELVELLKLDPPIKLLPHLLHNQPTGKQELAWQMYLAIAPADLTTTDWNWDMRLNLLDYLIANDKPTVPSRLLQLFDQIPPERRRPSSYRAAIVAYISLRMVGPAIQLAETVAPANGNNLLQIGLGVILKRTILDEQWPLCLRVFKFLLRPEFHDNQDSITQKLMWAQDVPAIWQGIDEVPNLQKSLQSLLAYIREFRHELQSSDENQQVLTIFTKNFVPHVIDQIFVQHKADERYIDNHLRKLFEDLDTLNLLSPPCYERAILRTLDMPRFKVYADTNRHLWVDTLYQQYLGRCNEKRKLINGYGRPSRKIFRELVSHYDEMGQLRKIKEVLQVMNRFYFNEHMPSGFHRDLIHIYARYGEVEEVQHYVRTFALRHRSEVNLFILSALPHAYARRGDVAGTTREFNRIEDHYNLTPDAVCWNILLLAFVRADDLDGAIRCFNKFFDNGIKPDAFTFNTLLSLCASRGDVEAYETLFSRAKELGISLTADVRARSGYVQTFLNAGDPKGAYALAQSMLRSWKTGRLHSHPLTHTWNILIQHHALNLDIASARARYKEMIANNIPIDSWTYGSLMRALIEVGQTNAAYKILERTMPKMGVRAEALHYAIVITGFLKEGGGQLDLAMRAYKEMIARDIPQTESSGEASMLFLGETELRRFRKESAQSEGTQLEATQSGKTQSVSAGPGNDQAQTTPANNHENLETALENIIVKALQRQSAHRQPTHLKSFDARRYDATAQSFYGSLVWLCLKLNTFEIVNKFLEKAESLAPDTANYRIPMNMIEAAMLTHLKAGRHAEVAKYWTIAREVASKLTRTVYQYKPVENPISGSHLLLDPTIIKRYEESKISNNRRHVLAQAAHAYIRSLLQAENPNPNRIQAAQQTFRELLVNGYALENFTWNEFVSTLANQDHVADAFKICEAYLMPDFPGWRDRHPNYIRNDVRGYSWMNLRQWELKKTSILPRYKTMIILATAMSKIRREEQNGRGYDTNRGKWLREIIYEDAPRTIRALETMPKTHDNLQVKYLSDAP